MEHESGPGKSVAAASLALLASVPELPAPISLERYVWWLQMPENTDLWAVVRVELQLLRKKLIVAGRTGEDGVYFVFRDSDVDPHVDRTARKILPETVEIYRLSGYRITFPDTIDVEGDDRDGHGITSSGSFDGRIYITPQ